MDEPKVLVELLDANVVKVIINNPQRRNALDMEVRDLLAGSLQELEARDDVRAVILTGMGEHFSAGGDIKDWMDFNVLEGRRRIQSIHRPLRVMLSMETPLIAMVRGYAVGAAMNLVLACDVIFASEDARFGQTFARMGLVPDAGGMLLLPMVVGLHRAKELIFSAEIIDSRRAYELGMVNRVTPKEELEDQTLDFAKKLAQGPTVALGLAKRILNATFLSHMDRVLELEAQAQAICFQTQDHKEGKQAFMEKREPRFVGR